MSTDVSNRNRVKIGRPGAGRFDNEHTDPALGAIASVPGLDDDALEEARRVYQTAEQRRQQATGHSLRAGVNLLAMLAQAKYPAAAEVRFRYDDENDSLRPVEISDADGRDLWGGPPSVTPEIDAAAEALAQIPAHRTDIISTDIQVLPGGDGILPLGASYDLQGLERMLGH